MEVQVAILIVAAILVIYFILVNNYGIKKETVCFKIDPFKEYWEHLSCRGAVKLGADDICPSCGAYGGEVVQHKVIGRCKYFKTYGGGWCRRWIEFETVEQYREETK